MMSRKFTFESNKTPEDHKLATKLQNDNDMVKIMYEYYERSGKPEEQLQKLFNGCASQ